MDEYLNVKDVATRVRRSEKSVRLWIKRGLPSYKPDHRVLLKWDEVRDWIERSRVRVAADPDARAILVDLFGERKTA